MLRNFSCDSYAGYGSGQHIADAVFDLYADLETNTLKVASLLELLNENGIRNDDPRIVGFLKAVREETDKTATGQNATLQRSAFKRCVETRIEIIAKVLKMQMVVPDWSSFTSHIREIFECVAPNDDGNLAVYIPQLARTNPNHWAVSICTIDGQHHSWGDAKIPFCLQSVSKPFTYAIALDELGAEIVHRYVGQEPSGRLFNEICLDHNRKPHNPMINAGAILVASLLQRAKSPADRFDIALERFKKFTAGYVGFNNSVYLSERSTADRNYALAYYMREHDCFPPNASSIQETLDFYFQLCAIETDTDTLSVMAATLANGGVSPMTGERVVCNRAVRDTLSLMYSCGMYDYSGQFAFSVGLPAKSGVSGDMIIVVPNVMGISIYSPKLDPLGNTVRGVKFAEKFVEKFNFHNYDSLVYSENHKVDPRKRFGEVRYESISNLMLAVRSGDVTALHKYVLLGLNTMERDYDDRTALHIAAAEGSEEIVQFLLKRWTEESQPKDRYGRTPLDGAVEFKHEGCAKLISEKFKT